MDHVVDDKAVLPLRAKHDDFRVLIDFDVVASRPVEQVIRIYRLLLALRIGRSDPAPQYEAPVRALAQIALQALEKRSGIDTG